MEGNGLYSRTTASIWSLTGAHQTCTFGWSLPMAPLSHFSNCYVPNQCNTATSVCFSVVFCFVLFCLVFVFFLFCLIVLFCFQIWVAYSMRLPVHPTQGFSLWFRESDTKLCQSHICMVVRGGEHPGLPTNSGSPRWPQHPNQLLSPGLLA